jgi:hypothetical protein
VMQIGRIRVVIRRRINDIGVEELVSKFKFDGKSAVKDRRRGQGRDSRGKGVRGLMLGCWLSGPRGSNRPNRTKGFQFWSPCWRWPYSRINILFSFQTSNEWGLQIYLKCKFWLNIEKYKRIQPETNIWKTHIVRWIYYIYTPYLLERIE